MHYTVWELGFYFFVYSLMGWALEVAWGAMRTGKFVNRGLFNGPICPAYGTAMCLILVFLRDMGGKPEILEYDSIPCKFGGTMDIADVYCRFDPLGGEASGTYLLLVAHLDSRFPEVTPRGDTVCSYGAADDGYGLGVVLELVRGALTYAGEWCQGVKVLFTDAEEHELDGIRCALERDNHIFDGVGLAVNVEARGVRGPALLFETSEGNAALMDFYTGYARFPYTYSLTSTVYGMMPNSTDFSYLSPLFPGFNFLNDPARNRRYGQLRDPLGISTNRVTEHGSQADAPESLTRSRS